MKLIRALSRALGKAISHPLPVCAHIINAKTNVFLPHLPYLNQAPTDPQSKLCPSCSLLRLDSTASITATIKTTRMRMGRQSVRRAFQDALSV